MRCCARQPGELTATGARACCWRTGSSVLAFSHENPVGVARGCSSLCATPRYGLWCKSFVWLPVSCKQFEYPRPTGFFGACINSASSFKMQTWAWRSRLFRLPLLAKESRGKRSVRTAERRCSPAASPDAERKTYPSISKCQQRSPGNYLLHLLSYLMIQQYTNNHNILTLCSDIPINIK